LEPAPVNVGEALEEPADFEVVAGHGADHGDQLLADVFGHGFLVDLAREVVAALGGILVEGALEEVKGLGDLAFELFLAEAKGFGDSAHKYAYIYAYYTA
jgi:hypothetical protein